MNTGLRPVHAPGVTLGYLVAGLLTAALWFGVGVVLIPAMLLLALLHGFTGAGAIVVVRSHHHWLARHHLLSAVALVLVLIAPLFALPALMTSAMTVANTLAYAPHPLATLAAAWPELGVPTLLLAVFVLTAGWLLVTLWISIRLIRRWLRWAERRPA